MGFLEKLLGGGHDRNRSNKHGRSHGCSPGGHHGEPQYRHDMSRPLDNGWGTSGTASPTVTVALVTCTNCNAPNDKTARFCQQCGQSLVIMKCTGCKSTLKPEAKFCDQCGVSR